MVSIAPDTTIKQYQEFINEVYGMPNERHFDLCDMLSNMERFMMRSLKGIRKRDYNKTKYNLLIAFGWFISTLNRLHIDLEEVVWKRFPYLCSYCGSCPCVCKETKIDKRQKIEIDNTKKPNTLEDYQNMFERIYPQRSRSIEHAGVHLAEEVGEFSEAILAYRGEHKEEYFKEITLESGDIFSCIIGIFNSLKINISKELSIIFQNNCHKCHKVPCECDFSSIIKFKS